MDIMDGMSMDIEKTNKEKLQAVFPECFQEGVLDIDKLLSLCGEFISNDFEKYKFEWKGKTECLQLARKRSTGTLRPVKDESVNFDTTENVYIKGDNLEVLKLLQTAYYRKVKMIYIDPPYNTGNDFVYEDDFADPMSKYREITQQTTKSNPETMGRFHTNWLNMMYPRLMLAANLLRDDGVIFISIDDNEAFNLKKLCDEVFGEENFIAQIPWRKRTAKSDVPFGISQDYEWIFCYAKSDEFIAALQGGTRKYYETPDFPNRPWRIHDLSKQTSASERPNSYFTIINPKTKAEYPANPNRTWAITEETFEKYYTENRIVFPGDYDFLNISKPALRYWKEDDMAKAGENFGFIPMSTNLPENIGMTKEGTKEIVNLFESKVFGFPKPINLIKYLLKAVTSSKSNNNDIILDFFSGSATTAHAVMQLNAEDGGNRKFICVQLPEVCDEKSEAYKNGYKNICDIGMERIRRAGKKILEQCEAEKTDNSTLHTPNSTLDIGFKVFELDTSNLKTWDSTLSFDDYAQEEIIDRMENILSRVKADRSPFDMVYEIMLKIGKPLTESVKAVEVDGKTAYSVGENGNLLICLAKDITPEYLEKLCELKPSKLVVGKDGLASDTAMSNALYICQDRSIELKLV